jgi:colicin import membrane protein
MSSSTSLQAGKDYSLPVIGAVTMHVVLGVLLFGTWQVSYKSPIEFEIPKNIKAEVVTIEAPRPEPKVVESPKPKPVPKPAPKPKETPKVAETPKPKETPVIKETPAPAENVIDLSEPKEEPSIPEVEPAIPEVEPQVEPEVSQEDLFNDLLAGLAAEETAINEQIEANEQSRVRQAEIKAQVSDYITAITIQIEEKWSRPVELRLMDLSNVEALVSVELLPTGELQSASIANTSGIENYDQSVLRAIEKVRRFKVPTDSEVFEAGGFRRLNITFRPEDL